MKEQKVKEILTFLQRTSDLTLTPRYTSSLRKGNNSVADHSWQLAVMVFVIGVECKVEIDLNRALALALFHDLAESRTGDIDAYRVITGKESREEKQVKEKSVMQDITNDLSFGDWIYNFWQEYEDQETIESKFVKALDKIEGFLYIAEHGVKAYIPKEFHADYADKAVLAFDEAAKHFPEVKDLLDMVKTDLKKQFEEVGVKWVSENEISA